MLHAQINLPTLIEPHYIILKRNSAGSTDQLIVDELKPIFGLHKMGTHAIRLRGVPRKINNNHPWIVSGSDGDVANIYIELKWSEYFIFKPQ